MKDEDTNNNPDRLSGFRTLRDDMAKVVQNKDQSLAQMVLKAQEARRQEESGRAEFLESGRNIGRMVYTVLILMVLGIVAILIAQTLASGSTVANVYAPRVEGAVIIPNDFVGINISGMDREAFAERVFQALDDPSHDGGAVTHIFFTKEDIPREIPRGGEDDPISVIPVGEFLSQWTSGTPDILTRSLHPSKYMFGVFTTQGGVNHPFLILGTRSYESTSAGMMTWERTMATDVAGLFHLKLPAGDLQVINKVVRNKDTRSFVSEYGQSVFFYGFIDTATLVIAPNETVFREILNRLTQTPGVATP